VEEGQEPATAQLVDPAERPRSVLFYVIDTLRADHLGLYGYERETDPFLAELAARSVVFERCYSQAPWTKPSVAAILTSRYPAEMGIYQLRHVLPDSYLTFPELLQQAGWSTAGFSANPIVGSVSRYEQGFERFDEVRRENRRQGASGSAAFLNASVASYMNSAPAWPQLLYVHSVDPHADYEPAPQFLSLFADAERDAAYRLEWQTLKNTRPPEVPGNHFSAWNFERAGVEPESFIAHGRDLYDGDIAANDTRLGELVSFLEEQHGWDEDVVILLTSDHGEEFFEHGGTSHGYSLYEEMIRVPLLIYAPRLLPEGLRIDAPVRSIDIYPTLAELLGLSAPESVSGRSLVPLILGEEDWQDEPVFSEGTDDRNARSVGSGNGSLASIVLGRHKLIVNYSSPDNRPRPRHELYDLVDDPGELRNLADAQPERVAELQARLEQWSALNLRRQALAERVETGELSPENMAELANLGYLGDADVSLPDIGDALAPQVQALLESVDEFLLLRIASAEEGGEAAGETLMYGYRVSASQRVKAERAGRALELLYQGLAAKQGGAPGACFEPSYAFRARHLVHDVELLLSPDCERVAIYYDGAAQGFVGVDAGLGARWEALLESVGL